MYLTQSGWRKAKNEDMVESYPLAILWLFTGLPSCELLRPHEPRCESLQTVSPQVLCDTLGSQKVKKMEEHSHPIFGRSIGKIQNNLPITQNLS